jgi:ATP-dependent Lon protease
MSIPKLTPNIAQSICDWGQNSMPMLFKVGALTQSVRLIRLLSAEARAYVTETCRVQELILTGHGWAIDSATAARLLDMARTVKEQAGADKPKAESDQEEYSAPKDLLEDEPKAREPLQIPPEGVLWTLCTGTLPSTEEVEECARATPERRNAQLQLIEAPERWLPRVTQAHIDAIRSLGAAYPNFRAVIDYYCRDLQLQKRVGAALRLPPVLLLGPPGLGKTLFAKALAKVLVLHLRLQSMAEVTAGWVLTGSAKKWNESTPGIIARHVAACPMGQAPMVVFDELDKAAAHHYYPADVALLSLLERHTAQAFRDENLDLVLDISPVSWLLTANRTAGVRPEILSRLKIFEIAAPTPEQMPAIVRSVDAALREESPILKEAFEPLDQALVSSLRSRAPRDLRRLLQDAYALVAEREWMEEDCLRLTVADLEAVGGIKPAPESPAWRHISIMVEPPGPWRLH